MMKENWSVWRSTNIPKGKYELISLEQNWNEVKLIFDDEKTKIEVIYKEEILAFRSCDESDRWKTIDTILAEKGGDFFKNKLLFKVENSEFKQWYIQENFNIRNETEFEHHVFVAMNDIIDVLAQVYRKLPETKNPEALLNRLVNYIRSVALAGRIHFPTNEEKLIADIGILGQRAGLNGVYMADYSAKSQFYSIFEEIPRH